MPLLFARGDITTMHADAIVCPTDENFSASGGTDLAIRRMAGIRLRAACRKFGSMQTGDVRRTLGYRLPCKYIFHVVAPRWQGGGQGEAKALAACYQSVLFQAAENKCAKIVFPLLGSGAFGIPHELAMKVAVDAIENAPEFAEMQITLVFYNEDCIRIAEQYRFLDACMPQPSFEGESPYLMPCSPAPQRQLSKVPTIGSAALDAVPEDTRACKAKSYRRNAPPFSESASKPQSAFDATEPLSESESIPPEEPELFIPPSSCRPVQSLEEALGQMDESFSEMLLRLIDERGMTDAQCYKKANIDRKLFSKIRSNPLYKPSKSTALSFAVALELSLPQSRELLAKAGFALSHSSKFDVIVEYYIERKQYDIYNINEALFAYDQALLGS